MKLFKCGNRKCLDKIPPDIHEIKGRCTLDRYIFEIIHEILDNSGIIVYPTDTLYGLGADPFDTSAVEKIYYIKNRPFTQPISIAVSEITMMESIAYVNTLAKKIYEKYLPGNLTIILKKRNKVPDIICAYTGRVGIRVPKHPFALNLIDVAGPITATSANLHNDREPTNVQIAQSQLGNDVDIYIDCGECIHKKPSTVIDISDGKTINVLRGDFRF
jgi:L-threonylcarbamoyladenylate synthase